MAGVRWRKRPFAAAADQEWVERLWRAAMPPSWPMWPAGIALLTEGRVAEAGYVVKQKDGRRNRYQIQAHLPLPEPSSQERTVGDVLALLTGTDARRNGGRAGPDR